ncbi:MAG: archaellin/type IV pilin N-terminal domain-containing protein [Candidatus Bathyarchaeia archaeon]
MARRLLRSKRAVVGIEAAIVLIAFIIVAAALSYVVVNMGLFITQKTKETMQGGVDESQSALQLDGVVVGKTNNQRQVEWIILPVKLSVGKAALDLKKEAIVVSVYLPNATLLNIYNGVYMNGTQAETDCDVLIANLSRIYKMNETDMAMSVIYNGNNNTVLESTEKAFIIIHLNSTVTGFPGTRHTVVDYETVTIEVRGARGAVLTVVLTVPGGLLENSYVRLG